MNFFSNLNTSKIFISSKGSFNSQNNEFQLDEILEEESNLDEIHISVPANVIPKLQCNY